MAKNNENKIEELPIEEFENDTQNIREEFLKKFGEEEEKPVEKSIDNDILIKNDYTKWL